MYDSITASELKQLISEGNQFLFLDVREPYEHAQMHIPGSLLLPLAELSSAIEQLQNYKDQHVVVYCKAGVRSAIACRLLASHGFSQLTNLADGIIGWRQSI
jgi:rhodanese-related sulfurtransferase